MERLKKNRLSTMQILALGFLGTILLGGVLLYLPICNQQPIDFLDALFTSVTAVCVTGLVTIVPATQFTLLGKVVLLILIQIGGLGIIACVTGFFVILKRRITVRERIIIQETYNMQGLSGMIVLILRILKGTFIMEGIGAFCYAVQFVPEFGLAKGVSYAIFHSISAFCNAGIDILGDSSFMEYVNSPIVNFTTMFLIIMGGIGFTVWYDVAHNCKEVRRKKQSKKRIFTKLTLHSKIALTMTLFLLVIGTVLVFALESHNPDTIGNMSLGEKWLASAFHSVSTRTAGFATISQSGLRPGTKFITTIFMFIGGSPGGTAGGIKTTTVAMLILTCLNVVYGKRDTECFGRKIPVENFRTGFSVVMAAFVFLLTGVTLLTVFEPEMDFLSLLYEAVSAIGTVGLTADVTPSLGMAGKIVIMCLMYIGRLGPITIALVFGTRKNMKERNRQLPEQRIMVG